MSKHKDSKITPTVHVTVLLDVIDPLLYDTFMLNFWSWKIIEGDKETEIEV